MKKMFFPFIIISLILLAQFVVAFTTYIKPPKMIARINLTEKQIYEGFLEVKNQNNVTVNVTFESTGNITDIINFKEDIVYLQPNETRLVNFTLKPKQSGYYKGNVIVTYITENIVPVALQVDMTAIAEGNISKYSTNRFLLYAIISLAFIVAVIILIKIKIGMKLLLIILISSFVPVSASNIILVVKNTNSLDYVHEYRINRILNEMGFNVTLVDKNNAQNIDYTNYVAIVIAGRPSNVNVNNQLDNFVASLPVNRRPTVVIDSVYPDDFGWIHPGAISTMFSNRPIYMTVIDNRSVFNGYNIGDKVRTHIIDNHPVLNMEVTRSVLNSTASLQNSNLYSAIAVAEPGTQLLNGNVTTSRIVFFGVTEPLYWTDEVEVLFKNSVNWVLYNQLSGVPEPILTGEYNLLAINIYKDGTQQFVVDLGKDMVYDKFWDPNRGIFTDMKILSPNNYALDINNDGRYEFVYENGVLHSLPDLIIESLDFDSQPQAGGQLNITIIVKNRGGYIARNFQVNTLIDTTVIDTKNIITLDVNQTYKINIILNNIPAGQHQIKATADAANNVFESNEDNNDYTRVYVTSLQQETTSTIQTTQAGEGGEKKVIIIQQGDINFTLPEKIEIEQGQSTVISGNLYNSLNYSLYNISFLVRGEGFSTEWYEIEPEKIDKLDPNQNITVNIRINLPENASIYTYQLIVKALTRSEYGSRTYTKTIALQVKEKTPQQTIETTVTTIPQERPEEKSLITGLVTFVENNWKLGLLIVILLGILILWSYPKFSKYFKGGYIIGKGWKKPKKK